MCSCSARDAGRLIGWIAAEFRYVWDEEIGKSARIEAGNTPSSEGPEEKAERPDAARAAALRRKCRRSTDMMTSAKICCARRSGESLKNQAVTLAAADACR